MKEDAGSHKRLSPYLRTGTLIHEKADGESRQPQVGDHLRHVDGQQGIDCLELDQHVAVNDEVDSVPNIQRNALVRQRDRPLSLEGQTPQREFLSDAGLVGRLEQARPQVPVDLDHRPDDLLRTSPEPPSLLASLFHSLSYRPRPAGVAHAIADR